MPAVTAAALAKLLDAKSIVFQGEAGANSHIACTQVFPHINARPMATFEDCFAALEQGEADLGMIPIENSLAGRVADIHHLLPMSSLSIVGEYFLPIHHQLLGVKGASLDQVRSVQSHVMALGQCRNLIRKLDLKTVVAADTAGSARQIAELNDPTKAAIASDLAADVYGLEILEQNIEDAHHNTTRFVILAKTTLNADPEKGPTMTSFVFRVRNVPAALYKALGGFATNGVNMTKLESYQLEGQFFATQFYAEVAGHPQDHNLKLALEELAFFSAEVKILGVYPASPFRTNIKPFDGHHVERPTSSK